MTLIVVAGAACGSGGQGATSAASGTVSSAVSAATATTASSTTAPSTKEAVPAGFSPFVDQVDRFSIAVPTPWRRVDPSSPGATATITELEQQNPKFKALFGSGPADLAAKGMKLIAVDVSGTSDYAPSVNVITKAAIGVQDSDLPSAVSSLKSEYQSVGATITGTSSVPLAGHKVLQIKILLPVSLASGTRINVPETQDLIAANDTIYIVTLAGTSSAFPAIESSFSVA